eukprot:CAMPEP_0196663178 /NCGR_PEP_ID=MMETSP1086-20130531/51807_1 /TAXON_ID=77921 /ORGANISM="Cyanoptyche  gloeocystis , Strain SAG4.97" /LENGTH=67 /DNA_ID=CAMNT_0041998893 /DNA_START=197 /DNA_END=400 /DNA_ORIENTATION=-
MTQLSKKASVVPDLLTTCPAWYPAEKDGRAHIQPNSSLSRVRLHARNDQCFSDVSSNGRLISNQWPA